MPGGLAFELHGEIVEWEGLRVRAGSNARGGRGEAGARHPQLLRVGRRDDRRAGGRSAGEGDDRARGLRPRHARHPRPRSFPNPTQFVTGDHQDGAPGRASSRPGPASRSQGRRRMQFLEPRRALPTHGSVLARHAHASSPCSASPAQRSDMAQPALPALILDRRGARARLETSDPWSRVARRRASARPHDHRGAGRQGGPVCQGSASRSWATPGRGLEGPTDDPLDRWSIRRRTRPQTEQRARTPRRTTRRGAEAPTPFPTGAEPHHALISGPADPWFPGRPVPSARFPSAMSYASRPVRGGLRPSFVRCLRPRGRRIGRWSHMTGSAPTPRALVSMDDDEEDARREGRQERLLARSS